MDWNRGSAVGRGSSATVFLASSGFSGEVFAVKSSELSLSSPLQTEQRILSSLSHPCVVEYKGFSVTKENGKLMYNLFMEFLAGGTLWDEIRRSGGRIKEQNAAFYARQIVRGLEYLHKRGFVHCDVKARNVLIGKNGAKISDFGCSKRDSPSPVAGTPMFMAPEVARGEQQGFAGDIWAVGCTVIEMVTGSAPWTTTGDPVSVLYRIGFSGETPEIPSFLSRKAKDFLEKCLKTDPSERWTASELLHHPFLEEFTSEELKESHSSSPTSILDPGLWNSLEESQTLPNPAPESSERWTDVRIRRLSTFSGEVRWETGENWVTVRDHESDESRRIAVEREMDLEERERRVRERMRWSEKLDNGVSVSLRKRENVVRDHISKTEREG